MMKLPHDPKAEAALLGSIMLDPRLIVKAEDVLEPDAFYDLKNKSVYEAMLELHADDVNIDFTTILSVMKNPDFEYVFDLSEHVPSTTHFDDYLKIVNDNYTKRKAINVLGDLLKIGHSDIKLEEFLDKAEEDVFNLTQKRNTGDFISIEETLKEVANKVEFNAKNKGAITGLRTGFNELDKVTTGFQPEELIIIGARPAVGKSAFALNLALNIAEKNKDGKAGVAIFSLEMSNEQLTSRMISNKALLESRKLRTGEMKANDWHAFKLAQQELKKLNIHFDDSSTSDIGEIRAKSRKLKQEGKLDFIIIDYLQLIESTRRTGNRQEEISRISRSLKQLARELKVPVLALSQLSRALEQREDKRPVLSDLRESGSIEQDADIVMFMYRNDYYERDIDNHDNIVELSVAKNRQGQSGVTIEMEFLPQFSKFRSL